MLGLYELSFQKYILFIKFFQKFESIVKEEREIERNMIFFFWTNN